MRPIDTSETVLSASRRRLLACDGWGSCATFWGSDGLDTG